VNLRLAFNRPPCDISQEFVLFKSTAVLTSIYKFVDILIINLISLFQLLLLFPHEESEVMSRSFILRSCTPFLLSPFLYIFCQKYSQVSFTQTIYFSGIFLRHKLPDFTTSFHAVILPDLFFDPEDGGGIFLRNVT
jgi:hypothetical protein